MKSRLAAITAVALILSIVPVTAAFADDGTVTETAAPEAETKEYPGHWGQVGSKWFYYLEDGTVARNSWVTSQGGTFWVNNDGAMAANQWVYFDDAWYYVDADGHVMVNQLLKLNSDLFWLEEDGKMVAGDWHQDEEGKWYYFQEDGKAFKNGWKMIGEDYYYFLKSGVMAADALVPGGERVGADGKMIRN